MRLRYLAAIAVIALALVIGLALPPALDATLRASLPGVAAPPSGALAGSVVVFGFVVVWVCRLAALALPFLELRNGTRARWVSSVIACTGFVLCPVASDAMTTAVGELGLRFTLWKAMGCASLCLVIAAAMLVVSYGVALGLARRREW